MATQVAEPESTPSARVIDELQRANCSFFDFALQMARSHKEYFASIAPMPADRMSLLQEEATASIERQEEIESADEISFEQYLANYFAED